MENNGKSHFTAVLISLIVAVIGWILFIIKFPTFITLILEVFAFVLVPKMDKEESGRIIGIIAKVISAAFLIICAFVFIFGIVSVFVATR